MRSFSEDFISNIGILLDDRLPDFLNAMQEVPSVSVRLNPRKFRDSDLAACFPSSVPCPWSGNCFYLPSRTQFTLDPLLHAGAYYVQDASSAIYFQVMQKITAIPGFESPLLLDMCAAPGGKTSAMIDALPDDAVVVANEFVPKRNIILRENLCKWGFPNVITTGCDSALFPHSGILFDVVAVDAPCSGEGMMRKEEEAINQWSPALVRQCASLQREILDNAVASLRPGGILLYSTCTFNTEENEENARYITDSLGLEPLDLHLEGVPDEARQLAEKLGPKGSLRFMPHITRGEGLYFSCFIKPNNSESSLSPHTSSPHPSRISSKQKSGKSPQKGRMGKDFPEPGKWLSDGNYVFSAYADGFYASSQRSSSIAVLLSDNKFHSHCGVRLAEMKGKDIVPTTDLVLSTAYKRNSLPEVDLPLEMVLNYLRRESISLPADTPKGFTVITYRNHPIGMVKNLGNRANNLYPKSWKIRNL